MLEWIKKYWAQITCIIGFIVAITTTDIQVNQNTKDIARLDEKQNNSDIILQDIRVELSSINTKLEMIMKQAHFVLEE